MYSVAPPNRFQPIRYGSGWNFSSAALPWDDYVAALGPRGKLCIVGIPDQPIALVAFSLIGDQKSIVGGQPGA